MVQHLDPTGVPADLAAVGYDGLTWDKPWNLLRGQITSLERMPSVELSTGGPPVQIPTGRPRPRCSDDHRPAHRS